MPTSIRSPAATPCRSAPATSQPLGLSLGMFEVTISGQVQHMTRQEIEADHTQPVFGAGSAASLTSRWRRRSMASRPWARSAP